MNKLVSTIDPSSSVPIVAIGASAGGIEAITALLQNLPPTTGMAYVYIQHLDATTQSSLPAILSRATTMAVKQAEQDMLVEPNHVYIIPPGKGLVLEKDVLKLNMRHAKPAIHFPIDQFFLSVAGYNKQATIGILLSGTSTDGVVGLKAIKAAGGITYVQDESAAFPHLPQAAIAEDVVDRILHPTEIAVELARLSKDVTAVINIMEPSSEADEEEDKATDDEAISEEDVLTIIQLLKKTTGVDFAHYKQNTIKRRIIRRLLLNKLKTLNEYYHYLKQNVNEINTLYQDLLINVTCFFRDPEAMEYLKKTVLPKLIRAKSPNEAIRVWVPACSSGEEAYSIAIILLEILGNKAATTTIQIFATDLSENAIAKARHGLYSKNILADVSEKRIQRFFTKAEGGYRIIKSIRDLCVFAPHNVFKDPPFSRLDLISCCNLFIYLEPILQKKVIATFHYALNPNAHLMLGNSEAIGGSAYLFTQLDKKYKIYSSKEGSSKALFEMNYRLPDSVTKTLAPIKNLYTKPTNVKVDNIDKTVDAIIAERFIPPSVIVNQDLEIVQFRGSTGLFLEPSPGKASFNLLKMARTELAFELRNIIHKANKSQVPAKKSGLEINYKNVAHTVSIEAIPLQTNNEERLCLIVFQEITPPLIADTLTNHSNDALVKQLQQELATMREDMRAIVEDQEASNEELQSANEEIVSSNEELQSINEELETSKEEVESSNEELMTINQELQIRNEQLSESNIYAETFFSTIRESVLVLDHDLRVKNANTAFYNTFSVKESETEDYLIYEIGNGQWKIPALRKALEEVVDGSSIIQGLEIEHTFPHVGEKVMLINIRRILQKAFRKEIILIAIEDITEHRISQRLIAEREAWFRNTADNAPVMLWVAGINRQCTFFNKTWFEYTGRALEEETGNGWLSGVHPDDKEECMDIYVKSFDERKSFNAEFRFKNKKNEYRWVLCNGKPTYSHDNKFTGYVGSVIDIHNQKKFSEELEQRVKKRTGALLEANNNLERSNSELEQFAYVASHDLQEPLRKILTFSDRLQSRFKHEIPENVAKYIDKIYESSSRMSRLIDDLLNFSRVTKFQELVEVVDLNKTVREVLKNLDLKINEWKVEIKIENKLPEVNAAPVQMIQLFQNLIGNAIKFSSSKKQPEIRITAHALTASELKQYPQLSKHKQYSEIVVNDNGIGFNQAYAEQIFIIFQRLNQKQNYSGTGIGLALCKKIVTNNGGTIFAKAAENKGAEFHVILPIAVKGHSLN